MHMATQIAYRNGEYAPLTTDGAVEPFVYCIVRTRGFRPLLLDEHIAQIDEASLSLFGRTTTFGQQPTADIIGQLLRRNGYASHLSHTVMLRSMHDGEHSISIDGTSIYEEFSLRTMRPRALMLPCDNGMLNLHTSATLHTIMLSRVYARAHDAEIVLTLNREGHINSVDGAAPIVVLDHTLIFSPEIHTPEYMLAMQAATVGEREVLCRHVEAAELYAASEVMGIDHRGITAVGSCGTHRYSDIVADTLAHRIADIERRM